MVDVEWLGYDPKQIRKIIRQPGRGGKFYDYHVEGVLPYVNHTQVRKVQNRLMPPTVCDLCECEMVVLRKLEVPRKRWPYFYACLNCSARIGCHFGTPIPLGTLADRETRVARAENKKMFWRMCEKLGLSVNEGYRLLSRRMGLSKRECHFAMFDKTVANVAGEMCMAIILESEVHSA